MVMVRYKRGLLRMIDTYGSINISKKESVDIIISSRIFFPTTGHENLPRHKGVLQSYGKTLVIDLQQSEGEIFADIHKNARYKINRANKRDPIIYQEIISPTDEQIQEFISFFDSFAKYKNIPNGNFGRLAGLRDHNAIHISYIKDEDSNVLCSHAYTKTDNCCSLLYSASARFENSQMRNMIGRANRYLHWQDIKRFKEMGYKWFDFGGLFVDANTEGEESINRFKKEFGGQVVDVDKRFFPLSLLGRMTVFLFWLRMRKRPDFVRAKVVQQNQLSIKNM